MLTRLISISSAVPSFSFLLFKSTRANIGISSHLTTYPFVELNKKTARDRLMTQHHTQARGNDISMCERGNAIQLIPKSVSRYNARALYPRRDDHRYSEVTKRRKERKAGISAPRQLTIAHPAISAARGVAGRSARARGAYARRAERSRERGSVGGFLGGHNKWTVV